MRHSFSNSTTPIWVASALLGALGCSDSKTASEGVAQSSKALCGGVTASITPIVAGSEGRLGQSFTIQGAATGCTSSAPEYRITHLRPGGSSWEIERDWSTSPSWLWNTASANAGGMESAAWHAFQILVREPGSVNYDAYKIIDYYLLAPPCTGGGTTTFSPAPANVGQAVTLTSTAPGCIAPEFSITHQRPGAPTYVLESAYSTSNSSWVWDTATANGGGPEQPGFHAFQILIRANGASTIYESYTTVGYNLGAEYCSTAIAAPSATSGVVGQTITVSSSAAGCGAPEYKILHLRPGRARFDLDSDYSAANASWNWNTLTGNAGTPEVPGNHSFQVMVREKGADASYQSYASFEVALSLPACEPRHHPFQHFPYPCRCSEPGHVHGH